MFLNPTSDRFKVDAPSAHFDTYSWVVASCSNEDLRRRLIDNPLEVINEIGLELKEGKAAELLADDLKSAASCLDTILVPPKMEKIDGIWLKYEDVRIILELDDQRAKDVAAGINIAAGVGGVFSGGATVIAAMLGFANAGLGLVGGIVTGVAAIYSGWLWAYSGLVGQLNHGNGVYLTVSVPQLVIAAAMILSSYFGAWWNLALAPLVCTPIPGTR